MKISYNWLKKYIELTESSNEIAEKLTLTGLEVEDIETIGSDLDGFVVGHVLDVKSHPNADKLQICDVDTGDENVQIICGAPNIAQNQKVAVAKVGATLPVAMKDGSFLTIKKLKLRGEPSNGMICSESELGISDDHSGIIVLNETLDTGMPLKEALGSSKDSVFEIGLTPNRPDASCHIGTARDLAAVLDRDLKNPYPTLNTSNKQFSEDFSINIEDTDKCYRYAGILIDNVEVKESPTWLKNSLTSIGLRPINNIVDVTNYVLHEIGQPLHAFDYNLVQNHKIEVKSFNTDKKFTTLDGIERNVPAGSLFICDGEKPVALAGIMGGKNSEVNENTTKILIESAYFEPSGIRKTSKQLSLQTDSSYRFERGIDPKIQLKAAYRAANLIAKLSGGTVLDGHLDIHPVTYQPKEVSLRMNRLNQLLGTNITLKQATDILERLEFDITSQSDDTLTCNVPSFRPDVSREIDLIEEVGRIFDYNNIPRPSSTPFFTPTPISEEETFYQRLKTISASLRYKEISTNSLLSKKEASSLANESYHIDTLNPVSQENTTLRTGLTAGFLKAVSYNLNRSEKHLRFFELGHVFKKSDNGTWINGVEEHTHVLLGLTGQKETSSWRGESELYSVFDIKSDIEAIWQSIGISDQIKTEVEGNHFLKYVYKNITVGKLERLSDDLLQDFDIEQEVFIAGIDVTSLIKTGAASFQRRFTRVAKYPVFEFDVAFTVAKDVRAGMLRSLIKETAGDILQDVSVFDVYEDEKLGINKKSIAFRLTFLDSNKTLNIKDVEPIVKKIIQEVETNTNAKLRS